MKWAILLLFVGCSTIQPASRPQATFSFAEGDSIVHHGEAFGSAEEPLTTDWAIYANGIYLEVVGCTFHLDGAHGIGLFASFDPAMCVIENNTFFVSDSLNRYVIGIGYDYWREGPQISATVRGNRIYCLEAETLKHNLFLGYQCVDPVVHGNEVRGGGYGIGMKGCVGGLITENHVYNTHHNAIVDKASSGNVFTRNYASVQAGCCFRIVDDDTTQAVENSTWTANMGVQHHEWKQLFAVTNPVSIEALNAYDNTYFIDRAGSAYSIYADFMPLEEAQATYGIEEGSSRYPVLPEDQSGVHPHETGGP